MNPFDIDPSVFGSYRAKELGSSDELEHLVREDPTLKQLFSGGIQHHLSIISGLTEDALGKKIDTAKPNLQFLKLIDLFATGFEGYVVRQSKTDRGGAQHLYFAKKEDLYAMDPTKLDTANGRRPHEIAISVSKYALTPSETNDPRTVFSNKGIQIAAFVNEAWFDPNLGKSQFQLGSGFSIRMPEKGGCYGIGTDWKGQLRYQRELITRLDNIPTNSLRQQLGNIIDSTPPVAFTSNFR